MKCPFCKGEPYNKIDHEHFNSPHDHLIITRKGTHTYVHGPFGNEFVIREMIKSLLAEAEKNGIVFTMPFEHRKGS